MNPDTRVAQIKETIGGGINISPPFFLLVVASKPPKSLGKIDYELKGCVNLIGFNATRSTLITRQSRQQKLFRTKNL